MSTENAPDTQVNDTKSKKRGKKRDKLKDKKVDSELDKSEDGNVEFGKRKSKKRKSKNGEAPQDEGGSTPNDDQSEDASDKSVTSKKAKLAMIPDSSEDGTEESKGNAKAPKGPSKRQLKRQKAEKRESEKKEASKLEATQKSLNYVSKWKHARKEWKFVKLRQIWLMDNLLNDKAIPDNMFPTVLEYFEGSKGMAREQLIRKGMAIIKKAEEDEENRDSILESIAYNRARQLLQALPTDT